MKRKYDAFLEKADGTKRFIEPENGTDFSLKELQGYVGGYIEIISLGRGERMVVNEEGKLLGLPYNDGATFWCRVAGLGHTIVGDAVICHHSQLVTQKHSSRR